MISSKQCSLVNLENSLEFFINYGYPITMEDIHHILDCLNKNCQDESLLQFIQQFALDNDFQLDVYALNVFIDFYCKIGKFEKSYAIFESMNTMNLIPDSYTYSLLIKGSKNMVNPNVE